MSLHNRRSTYKVARDIVDTIELISKTHKWLNTHAPAVNTHAENVLHRRAAKHQIKNLNRGLMYLQGNLKLKVGMNIILTDRNHNQ